MSMMPPPANLRRATLYTEGLHTRRVTDLNDPKMNKVLDWANAVAVARDKAAYRGALPLVWPQTTYLPEGGETGWFRVETEPIIGVVYFTEVDNEERWANPSIQYRKFLNL